MIMIGIDITLFKGKRIGFNSSSLTIQLISKKKTVTGSLVKLTIIYIRGILTMLITRYGTINDDILLRYTYFNLLFYLPSSVSDCRVSTENLRRVFYTQQNA